MNDVPTGKFPDYNHDKYGDRPGQLWSADEQCRILLRDPAALAFFSSTADLAVTYFTHPFSKFNNLLLICNNEYFYKNKGSMQFNEMQNAQP